LISSLLALALLLPQGAGSEPPILRAGETLEGAITDGDPAIHTSTLDKGFKDAPVVGRSVLVEVDEPGTYTLELRSYFFDSYLVLRDESGRDPGRGRRRAHRHTLEDRGRASPASESSTPALCTDSGEPSG
jgi:hypothetical protein